LNLEKGPKPQLLVTFPRHNKPFTCSSRDNSRTYSSTSSAKNY
jgi:hypothetical protein